MGSEIISLGGACDVGIALQWMRIKGPSYPFDWLANLEGGLEQVVEILENNFDTVNQYDSYDLRYFPEFSKRLAVYKNHPSVVHLHSNPLSDRNEHEKLVRRMKRFQVTMEEEGLFVHFLYYRTLDALIQKDSSATWEQALELLEHEGLNFVRYVRNNYSGKLFNITLVIQADIQLSLPITAKIRELNKLNHLPEIKYGFTIPRPDDNLKMKALWRMQWCEIVLSFCKLNFKQRIRVKMKWLQQRISFLLRR